MESRRIGGDSQGVGDMPVTGETIRSVRKYFQINVLLFADRTIEVDFNRQDGAKKHILKKKKRTREVT